MTLSEELRAAAQYTGLDGVKELLERAAAEIERKGQSLTKLLRYAETQTCSHDETHRAGVIWEVCSMCGKKWADDEGGKPKFTEPREITEARTALASQGEQA